MEKYYVDTVDKGCLNKLFFYKYIKIIFFIFKKLFLILIYQKNSKNKKNSDFFKKNHNLRNHDLFRKDKNCSHRP